MAASGLGWSDAVTRGFGFPEVFAHQARTYELMRDGRHVIITTPTASGKTGAFFPGVFDRLERDPRATALFVYPLVALGQDQRDKLLAFRERGDSRGRWRRSRAARRGRWCSGPACGW